MDKFPSRKAKTSWVELFSLSAVFHGLVIGVVAIGWGLMDITQGGLPCPKIAGESSVCFWDDTPIGEKLIRAGPVGVSGLASADLVPFTIQLSPIALGDHFFHNVRDLRPDPRASLFEKTSDSEPTRNWFGTKARPVRTAWVVDSSLSMGINRQFVRASQDLLAALNGSELETRVWLFAQKAIELAGIPDGWHSWSPYREAILSQELTSWIPAGGTDLPGAIRTVLGADPAVVHLLTDDDNLSQKEWDAVLRIHGRTSKAMPRFHVVVLKESILETPLKRWCRQGGCTYLSGADQ